MFKVNYNDLQSVVMDVESATMSMLADFRSQTDNAYINIRSGTSNLISDNRGFTLGTSNISDGTTLFGIAPYNYNSNITDAVPSFVIHNSNIGISNINPQYTLDVLGDTNVTSTYRMGGTTIIDSMCNIQNINNLTCCNLDTNNFTISNFHISNITASNINAQSLSLGGFMFSIPTSNVLIISYEGSNLFKLTPPI